MKTIICGAGEVGYSIADKLTNENFEVTVVDNSKEKLDKTIILTGALIPYEFGSSSDGFFNLGCREFYMTLNYKSNLIKSYFNELDTDYDDRSVYPQQVFFPMDGKSGGWNKLAKTLQAYIDEDLITKYQGTVSIPFEAGPNKRVAVKIIDDRGIESLKIIDLG